MKIAIHHREGGFSDRWIQYCKTNDITYKIVNAYDSDVIGQLKDCDALMWHHHHGHIKDVLAAKRILFALDHAGVKVFPNFKTGWHFDDKVAQKYLLEAIGAPLVPSHVFYDKKEALNWASNTTYPKVFKLKGGAGASNVKLVRDYTQAKRLINRAFGKGFSQYNGWESIRERFRKFKQGKASIIDLVKGVARLFIVPEFAKMYGRDKGYIYFQDFIPQNDGDIRLIVIGQKYAYGMKRMNREGDFRASGSSNFVYEDIPALMLKVAFETADRLSLQAVAFDFIKDSEGSPMIIEMSYGFGTDGSSKCKGYWTPDLEYHEEEFNPQGWMVENIIEDERK